MVFRYDGNSYFTVLLFDTTACEKEEAFFVRSCQDISTPKRKRGRDNHLTVQRSLRRKSTSSNNSMKKSKVHADPSIVKKCKLNRHSKEGSITLRRSIASTKEIKNASQILPSGKALFGVKRSALISQRRPITEKEAEKALKLANLFKSKNPFIVAVMKESYVYFGFFMYIPHYFGNEYLAKVNSRLTLWDPTGKPWTVNYLNYGNRCGLSGGWVAFSYANNLEVHDVCIFEIIGKRQIQVHIFRVVEKLKPLIRTVIERKKGTGTGFPFLQEEWRSGKAIS